MEEGREPLDEIQLQLFGEEAFVQRTQWRGVELFDGRRLCQGAVETAGGYESAEGSGTAEGQSSGGRGAIDASKKQSIRGSLLIVEKGTMAMDL